MFPRWVGYFNIWMALLFTPANILVLFKTGPFAWDGFFIWWIPFTAFLLWFPTNTIYLFKAVKPDDYEPVAKRRDDDLRRRGRTPAPRRGRCAAGRAGGQSGR